jgi:hypothetical protein
VPPRLIGAAGRDRGKERYDNLNLYKAWARKVGDAVKVLTYQPVIKDFVPVGGAEITDPLTCS